MGKKLREEGKWEEWSNDREEWEEGRERGTEDGEREVDEEK